MKKSKLQTFFYDLAADFRWSQLFAAVCLMILSTLFIYSATYRIGGGIPDEVRRQWIWFGIGLIFYFLFALLDYHWLCRRSWFFYFGVILLLIWVLVYGREIYGARRWINLHGFTIQPSEFAKLSVLLALCYYLDRCAGFLNEWRRIGFLTALIVAPAILINKQPDLGTALVIIAIFLALMFLAGTPLRFFGLLGIIVTIGVSFLGYETYRYTEFRKLRTSGTISANQKFKSYIHLKEYQLNRILGVIAPQELDRLAEGWNREQSLVAIGNGGFNGKGWTHGEVTHGGYLPRTVSLNDFIFAVFAEETGFLGGAILLGFYAVLLLGGIKIAIKAQDHLGTLLAAGITFLFFFHVFVNMGMTLGILPIVGVPLPLMSYGGSFVLVSMIALGLLQSVWLHRKPY